MNDVFLTVSAEIPHEKTGKLIVNHLEKFLQSQGVKQTDVSDTAEINYVTPSQLLKHAVESLHNSTTLQRLMKAMCIQQNVLAKESAHHHTTLFAIKSKYY